MVKGKDIEKNHFFISVCFIFNFPLICRISAKISIDQWKVISMKNQPENEKSEYHNLINYALFFRQPTNVVELYPEGNIFIHFCFNLLVQFIMENGKLEQKQDGELRLNFVFSPI